MIGPYMRRYVSSTCGELTDGGGAQAASESATSAIESETDVPAARGELHGFSPFPERADIRTRRHGLGFRPAPPPLAQQSVNTAPVLAVASAAR